MEDYTPGALQSQVYSRPQFVIQKFASIVSMIPPNSGVQQNNVKWICIRNPVWMSFD